MRSRPSSRILLLDPHDHVLLFQFAFTNGALAGHCFWATPGGALDEGETFEQAAIRELEEETGLKVDTVGREIGRRQFIMQIPSGEHVMADECFFAVRTAERMISNELWTELEKDVMTAHRWWSLEEIAQTTETIYPEDLSELLRTVILPD